jgi:predicted SprT family Zn-dependent metalloprotease
MGYFSAERWANSRGKRTHEIAMNPAYFARHKLIEVLQTLVHEQCHLWQCEFGKPSRAGYHNREWAARMESIGLMPSHNGAVNGRKTGQTMSDYPIKGGKFIQACKALIEQGYRLSWIDRFAAVRDSCQSRCTDADVIGSDGLADADIEKILNTQVAEIVSDIEPVDTTAGQKTAKAKTKYVCERCAINLWGRPGLNVICGQCHLAFAQHV